jgi:stage V sporulation protein AD
MVAGLVGKQTVIFKNKVRIIGRGSVVGKKEGEGPFGKCFNEFIKDPMIGGKTWEEGESNLISKAADYAILDSGIKRSELNFAVGGDLLGQLMATTFGVSKLDTPFFGIYGACSTMGEALAISSLIIDSGNADTALAVTSSHFAGAEKQFRFPLGYGAQRPKAATWTVTGSGAVILSGENVKKRFDDCGNTGKAKKKLLIKGFTAGKIVNFGVMDSSNMGAAMAPAAADTLNAHFKDTGRGPKDYDLIVTGDLGAVGAEILQDFLRQKGYEICDRYFDCGLKIFDNGRQDTHSGGSGCGCSASMLCGYLLKELEEGRLRRILFMPTGALLSPVSFHEGKPIPGIAHAIIIESE